MRRHAPSADATRARPRARRWRAVLWSLPALAAALLIARAALPGYLRDYVNRALNQGPEYRGRISEIDVHLWRGAYTIRDLAVVKNTNAVPVPFVECPRIDLALDWHALLHAQARGRLLLEKPKLHFVDGPSPEETQTGADQPWLAIIDGLFPFRIDRAEVMDGQIHFHSFHAQPPVNIFLSSVNGSIENLTNVNDTLDPLIATVHATGEAMGTGRFRFDMSLDPRAHLPSFSLAARLLNVDVTRLNDLTRAYGGFDFEAGRFDLVVELSTSNGYLDGYAKPLFRDVTILSVRDLQQGGPVRALWEGAVGAIGEVFKNRARDQVGTRFTIQGDLDNPRTSLLEIVGNALYNAFVRAYLPRTDGSVAPDVAAPREKAVPAKGNSP